MQVRKAYIDWNKLGRDTRLTNKGTYMVCTADGDTCDIRFATWYEKGTVVSVGIADDVKIDGQAPTAEERLLRALFGRRRSFVVPEDGFYIMTGDYGVDEEGHNGAFEDCKEQLVCAGNRYGWDGGPMAVPSYWAEVPILPDGLRLPSERRPSKPFASERMARRLAEVEKGMAEDRIAEQVYQSVFHDVPYDGPAQELLLGSAVYSVQPLWFAMELLAVHAICGAMAKTPEQAFLDLHDEMAAMADDAAIDLRIDGFCQEHDIPQKDRWLMFQYIRALRVRALQEDHKDFYWHRDRILAKGGTHALDTAAVLQEALAYTRIQFRVARLVKLERLEAPDVIRLNELRMLTEYLAMGRLGNQIVQVRSDFDQTYGVQPDGSRGSRWCKFGDMELGMLPQPAPDDAEEDTDDGEDEAREKNARVIGVDYPYFAATNAPNFLMRKHRFVIWDNVKHEYVRDASGRIEGYDKFPKDRLAAMNESARLAANG